MNPSQTGLVYRKELLDTLRDRRTLISMIVVPMIVIPGMMFGMGEAAIKLFKKAASESAPVMILGEDHAPSVAEKIRQHRLLEVVRPADDYVSRIEDKELRAAVEFPADFERQADSGQTPPDSAVKIYYYDEEVRSELARRNIEHILEEYKDTLVERRLAERDLDASVLQPFEARAENVASAERVGGATVGGFIPYIIILLTLTGAMYPAIDLTAGEKERGTIETILASPVSRASLATGKFLTVLTASLCTALLSLASLAVSSRFSSSLGGAMDEAMSFSVTLSGKNIVAMLVMVLPVAVMFSAALLAIALLAKSYKEAQSYISPLMIVVILPAVSAMLPGIELDNRLALVPILNVSLVSKELITGIYHWNLIGLIFVSSCAYAAIALAVAGMAFRRESVLFRT